jgi:hypothetical protein
MFTDIVGAGVSARLEVEVMSATKQTSQAA